jgi:predicted PurR-regulated permease PerM
MTKTFEISWDAIFKIAFSILLFYFLFQIHQILIWILYAFVISILLEGPIHFLTKRKVSRNLATILVYFLSSALFIFLIYSSALPLLGEIQNFINLFPVYFEKISPSLKSLGLITFETFEQFTQSIQQWLLEASKNIISAIGAIFGGVFAAFSIFSLAIFISLEKNGVENIFKKISKGKWKWILETWKDAKEKISLWFGVRILSCFFVGFATFVSLLALKINYPFSLSVVAGISNFIPILGPIFSGILIFIFALFESFFKAIFALILFILIQQIEGNILGPILAKKIIGMPPFLVLVSLLIGGKLLGIGGAILAVPLTGIVFKILQEIFRQ